MKQQNYTFQLVRPKEFSTSVGLWIRSARQRADWTQAMLASRAGVPASTLSRLERQGAGSLPLLSKLLFALGEIDSLHDIVQERIRAALLPADLSRLPKTREMPRRIRPKGQANEPPRT